MKSRGKQLELLPLPKQTAAQRKAFIRERLHGFEYRQAAREALRRAEYDRRKARGARRSKAGREAPRQLTILGVPEGYLF